MGARSWDHIQGSLFPWKPALSKGAWGSEAPVAQPTRKRGAARAHLGKVFVKAAALAPSPHGVAGAGRRAGCIGAHQPGQCVGARTCRRSSRERVREGLEETGAAERGSLPSLLLGGLAPLPVPPSTLALGQRRQLRARAAGAAAGREVLVTRESLRPQRCAGCAVGPLLVLSSSPSLQDAQAEGPAFARVSVPGGRSVRRGSRRKAMDCTGGHLKTCLLAASVR